MPNRVARALKTRVRGFLACFAKPLALQMKNRETGFGDDEARGFTIMYSPHQSFELLAHFKCCSYAMFDSKSCGVIEEGNRISSRLRPVSEQSQTIQKSPVLYSHQFNGAPIVSSLL